jgi:two-component system, chemotaxis family, chemotaxis protein CheY
MRALIVDDSRAIRMVLRRALGECGFDDFAEAGDGSEALNVLSSGPLPEAAFVDWNMPVMNGLEFVQAARSNSEYASMAIIMVTSETAFDHVESALAAGADEYVMKPFTSDVLTEKLALVRAARS